MQSISIVDRAREYKGAGSVGLEARDVRWSRQMLAVRIMQETRTWKM